MKPTDPRSNVIVNCSVLASDPVGGYGIYSNPGAEAWRSFMRWVGLLSGVYEV